MQLSQEKCIPCQVGTPTIPKEEAEELLKEIPDWKLKDSKSIERKFKLGDFKQAIEFVNRIAEVAEAEEHHPDICIYYDEVNIELWTHKIGGLSRNDFILAAKIDEIMAEYE
ncbi:MAG TPA: 4a-hydroxytetrahydrobiopterin dehydratase [Armatimonadota bacterium]|nr:4a-hydroxytetrahydrobiopterin dehydratase [Armatimonadota bacterium]HOM70687.1 4a-hydroxytetrahydrobiopterin dehydratase [Armatimonadota bacterium]HOP79415.1 4a-hydroxytetrahydrobiopterin dehydratase [Armatimonadota bacterium]HPP73543.1 4a-hydroxytetrahydrobiopterin dehydratase [Armatimonadota bacterium]